MSKCFICTESFTKNKRKQITCFKCDFVACLECVKHYLLTINHEPTCMSCNQVWGIDFIHNNLPSTFLKKDYYAKRIEYFYEIEKALFPQTRALLLEREIHLKRISEMKELIRNLEWDVYACILPLREFGYSLEEARNDSQYIPFLDNKFRLLEARRELKTLMDIDMDRLTSNQEYVHPCADSRCKGMLNVLNACVLCERMHCRDCLMIDDMEHEVKGCDENVVKSIQRIREDCKPCPQCRVLIHKVDGCNQMFCTKCKTVFDWESCRITNGAVHNPHYLEWVMKDPNGEADRLNRSRYERCRNPASIGIRHPVLRDIREQLNFFEFRHLTNHNSNLYKKAHPKFDTARLAFLGGNVKEEEFKVQNYGRYMDQLTFGEFYDIFNTFITSVRDMVINFAEETQDSQEIPDRKWKKFIDQSRNFVIYTNRCLKAYIIKYKITKKSVGDRLLSDWTDLVWYTFFLKEEPSLFKE
jgi:hypothetical protein